MKLVTTAAWLEGLTATGVIIIETIFGLLSLYKARKMSAKLLLYAGFLIIFTGFLYLGPFIDFILVVFTGKNLEPDELYPILSYMWLAPGLFFSMIIGGELIVPKKKWIVVGIFLAIGIVFEFFLWGDTVNSFSFAPIIAGEDIIDTSFNRTHPTFILIVVILISVLFFNGIGFLIKAYQTTGAIRKKFLFIALAFIIFVISGAFDSLVSPGLGLVLARIGMMIYAVLMYLGLKT